VRFLSVEPLLEDVGTLPLEGIAWVIVGGESGPGARLREESWVVSIQKQCKDASVPCFFKQWGGVRKKVHGRTLRGRTHDGFPQRVKNPTLPTEVRLQRALQIERSALVQIGMA
jgi:protein gp37